MATQYAGGARRSVAPEYSPRALLGTPALGIMTPNEQVTSSILQSFRSPDPYVTGGYSDSGRNTGGTIGTTGTGVQATAGSREGLSKAGTAAGLVGGIGQITNNPGLAEAGKTFGLGLGAISLGANLANAQSFNDVAKSFAASPAALASFGVPGIAAAAVSGLVAGGVKGATEAGVKGLAYGLSPHLGVLDMALSLMGIQGVVDRAFSSISNAINSESGDVRGGVGVGEGGFNVGVTVGGPMSVNSITGTELGTPTGPDFGTSFSAPDFGLDFGSPATSSGGGYGNDGGYAGMGGGYGVGSGSQADSAGGFGSGTSGMGD